jgi:hypothetical protein
MMSLDQGFDVFSVVCGKHVKTSQPAGEPKPKKTKKKEERKIRITG